MDFFFYKEACNSPQTTTYDTWLLLYCGILAALTGQDDRREAVDYSVNEVVRICCNATKGPRKFMYYSVQQCLVWNICCCPLCSSRVHWLCLSVFIFENTICHVCETSIFKSGYEVPDPHRRRCFNLNFLSWTMSVTLVLKHSWQRPDPMAF